jgi:hypothetical protein
MFQRPVQYVTTETILDIGLDSVQGSSYTTQTPIIPTSSIKEDKADITAGGPVNMFKASDDKPTIKESTTTHKQQSGYIENVGSTLYDNSIHLRGDHILWIQ